MGGISTDYLKKLEAEDAELLSQWRELQMTKMDIEAEIDAEEESDDELVPCETWYSDDEDDKDDWYKDESIIKNVGFKKYVSEIYGISQKKVNNPSIIKKKSKQPLVEQIKKDIDNSTVKKLVNQIIS